MLLVVNLSFMCFGLAESGDSSFLSSIKIHAGGRFLGSTIITLRSRIKGAVLRKMVIGHDQCQL